MPPHVSVSFGDESADHGTTPIALVLDADFDIDDEEVTLGHARHMAGTLRDEEDWFLA